MRILLQFPEGLKREALQYQEKYEKQGHEVFIASAPCYGACDLSIEEAKAVKADKIIHFGHARFISATKKLSNEIEIEYILYYIDVNLELFARSISELSKYKTLSLATTIQHIHQLDKMKQILEKNGHAVLIEKGVNASEKGQVLGCDALAVTKVADKADAILFVGDGVFHALAIETKDKPVFVIQPQTGKLTQINDQIEKLRKKRKGAILAAIEAKTFGILVSTKVGQFHLEIAQTIKKELEQRGKKAMILVSNEIEPLPLKNFMLFNCYVNTSCPRLSDDTEELGKPCVNYEQLKEAFKVMDELGKS
ncbi:MAG: diphthamide biosynthesis enzyme Dph2 [Candidatus Micrarchaeota archaeon]